MAVSGGQAAEACVVYLCHTTCGACATQRVVRGGSWNNHQDNARVAARNRNNPNNSNNNNGVRLASHASSVLPEMSRGNPRGAAEAFEERRLSLLPAGGSLVSPWSVLCAPPRGRG